MTHAPRIAAVTDRIRARSRRSRAAYRAGSEAAHQQGPNRSRLSCGNLAHAFAACGPTDKGRLRADATPNLGIVDAYNDMLSAHQPFETYPALIRSEERRVGKECVSVDLGGRRIIKKKTHQTFIITQMTQNHKSATTIHTNTTQTLK